MLQDGGDIERFLRDLHDRCWLHGLGWHMIGSAGQLLDRSLVDRMVAYGERLCFEGAPIIGRRWRRTDQTHPRGYSRARRSIPG